MSSVDGKTAVVTGGANGIGKATAEYLVSAGARVAIADLDEDAAHRVASEISRSGSEAIAFKVDISEPTSVERMIAQVKNRFGRIDILHNNAADTSHDTIGRDSDVVSIDLDVWDRAFAVNLRGTLLVCRYAIPVMIEGGGGAIVNMTSNEGLLPRAGIRVAYATSKAAICMLTRHVAASYGKQGIRCNAIAPGTTLTETLKSHIEPVAIEAAAQRLMTTKLGEPIDIARLVAFLASEDSCYITGQIISADGGILAFQNN